MQRASVVNPAPITMGSPDETPSTGEILNGAAGLGIPVETVTDTGINGRFPSPDNPRGSIGCFPSMD